MFASKDDIQSIGRLKKRSDFLRVQKEGNKWVSKGMIVELASREETGLRYGLTVSKRVSKLAVTRNRIKRRLRAVACEVLPAFREQSIDVVLIGRVATAERDYQDLKKDLIWCLGKLGYDNPEKTDDKKTAD